MNASQINEIFRRNRFTCSYFRGVFASNELKHFSSRFPYCFIANTGRRDTLGEHWVAFFVSSKERAEYFDSLGEWPPPVQEFSAFLQTFKHVKYNKAKIQAAYESSCGPHTIYFLLNRCRGRSFESIVAELKNPLSDAMVKLYVYHMVK